MAEKHGVISIHLKSLEHEEMVKDNGVIAVQDFIILDLHLKEWKLFLSLCKLLLTQ